MATRCSLTPMHHFRPFSDRETNGWRMRLAQASRETCRMNVKTLAIAYRMEWIFDRVDHRYLCIM